MHPTKPSTAISTTDAGIVEGEYPIWSPHDAHEAAATLLRLLEEAKAQSSCPIQE